MEVELEQIDFDGNPRKRPCTITATVGGAHAFEYRKRARHMNEFKDAVIALASSKTTKHLTSDQMTYLEQRLHESFHLFRPPSHPTYAAMIEKAILDLNEEGGSREESISRFIRSEYEDLPWAHSRFLSHHLKKLTESEEIVVTSDRRYMIASRTFVPSPIPNASANSRFVTKRGRGGLKGRGRVRGRGNKIYLVEEENLDEKQENEVEGVNRAGELQKEEAIDEGNLLRRNDEMEELNQSWQRENKVIEELSQPMEQATEMVEEESQPHKQQNEEQDVLKLIFQLEENGVTEEFCKSIEQNEMVKEQNRNYGQTFGVIEGQSQSYEQENCVMGEQCQPEGAQCEFVAEKNQSEEWQNGLIEQQKEERTEKSADVHKQEQQLKFQNPSELAVLKLTEGPSQPQDQQEEPCIIKINGSVQSSMNLQSDDEKQGPHLNPGRLSELKLTNHLCYKRQKIQLHKLCRNPFEAEPNTVLSTVELLPSETQEHSDLPLPDNLLQEIEITAMEEGLLLTKKRLKEKKRILRSRRPISEPASRLSTIEYLPSHDQYRHEETQPRPRGRGRPRKLKPGFEIVETLLPPLQLLQQQVEVQGRERGRERGSGRGRGRGRGRGNVGGPGWSLKQNPNADIVVEKDEILNSQERRRGIGRGRGRGRGRDKGRGPGRSSKQNPAADIIVERVEILNSLGKHQQPKRRGRPPKLKQNADTWRR